MDVRLVKRRIQDSATEASRAVGADSVPMAAAMIAVELNSQNKGHIEKKFPLSANDPKNKKIITQAMSKFFATIGFGESYAPSENLVSALTAIAYGAGKNESIAEYAKIRSTTVKNALTRLVKDSQLSDRNALFTVWANCIADAQTSKD